MFALLKSQFLVVKSTFSLVNPGQPLIQIHPAHPAHPGVLRAAKFIPATEGDTKAAAAQDGTVPAAGAHFRSQELGRKFSTALDGICRPQKKNKNRKNMRKTL